ncbi:nitroreductase [Parasphingorhabdus sp.]|uniref:nitroreductase family protein n=1 Tax=Parasphingorhabdus sp. TaxID=2709688 RepID=UPI0032636C4F
MTNKTFNNLDTLDNYFASRRSSRPRNMIAPGPTNDQLGDIVETALRTPDHGKLSPWRVLRVDARQRDKLAAGFVEAYRKEKPGARRVELEGLETIAHEAPALLVVLFSPVSSSKIPVWEQELSAGAFCMNLVHAIHARGFVGGWITGWPAYNDDVRDMFGNAPERIAGFIFSGTPKNLLEERPRPNLKDIYSSWDDSDA